MKGLLDNTREEAEKTDDRDIKELFFRRDESALDETARKYGSYCRAAAYNILESTEDTEECVNDTWLRAWNAIPPSDPPRLDLFLGKITRESAINMKKAKCAQKRGGGKYIEALDELDDVFDSAADPEKTVEAEFTGEFISAFLRRQKPLSSDIFVRRYYHFRSVSEIADEFSVSESRVRTVLYRLRKKLRSELEKEGLW